jgi:glycosyltransferase involved in cell wall biosynthesis
MPVPVTVVRDEAQIAPATRVLVFRSCRMPVFAETMAWIRQEWPAAIVDVLTSPEWDEAVRGLGAARVFHYSGSSIDVRHNVQMLVGLRRECYEVIVVPQMSDADGRHANLYRAIVAIAPASVVIAALGRPRRTFGPRAFLGHTVRASLSWLLSTVDVPVLLVLQGIAYASTRRAVRPVPPRRRVLHVITSFGVGGAQVQLAELLARTPAEKYDVEVLVLSRGDGDFSRQWLERPDVRFRYADGWPCYSLCVLEIARLCRKERYDLVHTWLFIANVVGAAGARLGGVPRVLGSVRNLSLWKHTWYAQWWYRLADALATRIADQVTVNATPLVADHAGWTWTRPERLVVVPNGLDPARVISQSHGAAPWLRAQLGVASDTPVVGTVGRLAMEKDQEMFLRAVALVREQRQDLQAVIVGDGALRQDLERRAQELGLGDHVHFLGERTDSRRIIAGLDVFVLTSRIEGFPNVLLEAAFLGVPAIATAVGGSADVLDGDDLVEPGDAAHVCRSILARLEHRTSAQFRAAVIRRRAFAQFTAEHTAARWLAVYDKLLSDRGDGQ